MAAAYIEHRPRSTDPGAAISHFVIVVGGGERDGTFRTQTAAKDRAYAEGHAPVHVARVRHMQDRDQPDHWRNDPPERAPGRVPGERGPGR